MDLRSLKLLWLDYLYCYDDPDEVLEQLAQMVQYKWLDSRLQYFLIGDFEDYKEDAAPAEASKAPAAPAPAARKEDVTKFGAKKTKAASKTVAAQYQFQIMLAMGMTLIARPTK